MPAGVIVVTDRHQAAGPLPAVVAGAVAGGARWVLLREKDLPRPERLGLAAELREVLAPVGGRLIVAGRDPLGGAAVHLAAAEHLGAEHLAAAAPPAEHPPAEHPPAGVALVGRSCHTEGELDRLVGEDYVTVSPVFASTSKPGYGPALGLDGLSALCRRAGRPVLALGGIETAEQAAACMVSGAAGVAVMGAVMRAPDPAAVVAELCAIVAAIAATTAHSPGRGAA